MPASPFSRVPPPGGVAERNALLRRLRDRAPAAHAALASQLAPTTVTTAQVLWRADRPIHAVYFPRTCVTSLLTPLADETPVESATVGCEGFVGCRSC